MKVTDGTPIYEFESVANATDGLRLSAEPKATEELGVTLDNPSLQSASVRIITKMDCHLIIL
jgi:hypothetical protein